jgi:hypothetical protein
MWSPLLLDNGTVNAEFAVSYRGGAWTSITVDMPATNKR